MLTRRLFAAFALLVSLLGAAATSGWSGSARAQIFNPTQFTLANGLQVVLIEDHRAPIVHHMVWYRVGAADEPPGLSGVAHYLEHLMFKGTPSVPPGEFSKIVAREGGRDNAFTSSDYTGYYQTIARDRLELVMRMEAERMAYLNPRQEDAVPELQVVLQERLSRTDNSPGGLFSEQFEAAQYLAHPYGRPIIGWPQEVARLTLEDAMQFYRAHYAPNNAFLIVAGDVSPDELRQLAEKHYGPIPRRSVPLRSRPQEPPQLAARRLTMMDARVSQPSLRRSYLAPSRNSSLKEHAVPLAVLTEILNGPAVSANAWYDSLSLDQRSFGFGIAPKSGRKLEEVEAGLDRIIADLLKDGVTEDELRVAKSVLQAETIFARDSLFGAAQLFGVALTSGLTVEDVEAWPRLLEAVTREQILAAARHVFDPPRSVTGYLLPKEQS
jgi:zinc protease